jgi:hypothetical protein
MHTIVAYAPKPDSERSTGEIMKKAIPFILLAFLAGCVSQTEPEGDALITSIQGNLPDGWESTVEKTDGQKGHPHGLKEPVFRADYGNPNLLFGTDRRKGMNPSIKLYFYQIDSKPNVMKVIDAEREYSWNIPIYFGETEEYVVVTSPLYVNHGVFTEEAKKTIRPMWNVLRKHIECKEDRSVEQLAQP